MLSKLLIGEVMSCSIILTLENYCRQKVLASNYKKASGFGFERIVFSYLDYLLFRDGYSYNNHEYISKFPKDWQFQFRNSIEHFYPQNPEKNKRWEEKYLQGFGNLALITISGNSRFSNSAPPGKISTYPSIINQSLKLIIMKKLTNKDKSEWTEKKQNYMKKKCLIF